MRRRTREREREKESSAWNFTKWSGSVVAYAQKETIEQGARYSLRWLDEGAGIFDARALVKSRWNIRASVENGIYRLIRLFTLAIGSNNRPTLSIFLVNSSVSIILK